MTYVFWVTQLAILALLLTFSLALLARYEQREGNSSSGLFSLLGICSPITLAIGVIAFLSGVPLLALAVIAASALGLLCGITGRLLGLTTLVSATGMVPVAALLLPAV